VTHDSRVFEFGDRIAYMNDGQIVRNEAREPALDNGAPVYAGQQMDVFIEAKGEQQ